LGVLIGLAVGLAYRAFAQAPDKDMIRLQRGEVITSMVKDPASGDYVATGRVIFDAGQELSWKVLTDYQAYPEFLFEVKELKVSKRDGNKAWIDIRFRNLFPFPDFRCLASVEESLAEGSIKIKMESGDFQKYYASWKLTPLDQSRVLAQYRLYRYIGWWWFPFWPNPITNESMVSDQLNAFRKQIRLVKDQKFSRPDDAIKPFWRKSRYKSEQKPKSVGPSKETKAEPKADQKN